MVIAGGDCVYKLDYGKVLEYHIEKKADITVVCKEMPPEEDVTRFGLVKLNDDGRITDLRKTDAGDLQHDLLRYLCNPPPSAHRTSGALCSRGSV